MEYYPDIPGSVLPEVYHDDPVEEETTSSRPREFEIAVMILSDIISKQNMGLRALVWALRLNVAPLQIRSLADIGRIAGVGRGAAYECNKQITSMFPEMLGRVDTKATKERHRLTTRSNTKL